MNFNTEQFKAFNKLGEFLKRTSTVIGVTFEIANTNYCLRETLSDTIAAMLKVPGPHNVNLNIALQALKNKNKPIDEILSLFISILNSEDHRNIVLFINTAL